MTPPAFLVDECCPASVVAALRGRNLDVRYVAEEAAGLSDADVMSLAIDQGRILVTTDKDFGNLALRLGHQLPGVVLIRVKRLAVPEVAERIAGLIGENAETFPGCIATIGANRIRRRPL